MPSPQLTPHQRARFEALRARMFGDVTTASARWRLVWTIPFYGFVLGLLVVEDASWVRIAIQTSIFVPNVVVVVMQATGRPSWANSARLTLFMTACYLASIANTGGMASPFLPMGFPILVSSAMHPKLAKYRKRILAVLFVSFVAMAVLAHSAVGYLPEPFDITAGYASWSYVVVALLATLLTASGVDLFARNISLVYQQVAIELATNREELFTESEDRTRALEGVAARLAHEVKNPLAAIRALSAHVAKNTSDPKAAERLGIISGEAERLQEIVDGFLSFSRGLEDLNIGVVRPFDLVRSLFVLLETRAEEAGVRLEVSGNPALEIQADGRKLKQALLNLILNGMQASQPGAVIHVEIAKAEAGTVILKVVDEGIGMSKEVLDRIQRPYFSTKKNGSGLGVAVARGIVEQHGGSLRFETSPGHGTQAVLELDPSRALLAARLPKPKSDERDE